MLPRTTYVIHWFNPRTGEWKAEGDNGTVISDDQGMLRLPPRPSDDDWAIRLKVR
jgi:hypothetical protein